MYTASIEIAASPEHVREKVSLLSFEPFLDPLVILFLITIEVEMTSLCDVSELMTM
jgi:hypothetical protein